MKSKLTTTEYGGKIWKLPNGDYHRENGPAIVYSDGYKSWWIDGIMYTEQKHRYEMRCRKLKQLL
jgi:hypothetical protein